jgi:hypothetical protein
MTALLRADIERVTVPEGTRRDRAVAPSGLSETSHLRYDFDTFFYHAVRSGDGLVLIAPKLLNFRALFKAARFDVDGEQLGRPKVHSFYRHAIIRFKRIPPGTTLGVEFPDGTRRETLIAPDETDFLAGLNCQMTISKDNNLEWIRQQLTHHVENCGVEAVCYIDNGSTAYSLSELEEVLTSVNLKKAVLISMPFKWGGLNKTTPNRELYLQTAAYNLARLRFLSKARGVLRIDTDEIMTTPKGAKTVFDEAQAARLGFVFFYGSNRLPPPDKEGPFEFSDHVYTPIKQDLAVNNWCVNPQGVLGRFQWRCHNLEHNILEKFQELPGRHYYHCLGIGTGWKGGGRLEAARLPDIDQTAQTFWTTGFAPTKGKAP